MEFSCWSTILHEPGFSWHLEPHPHLHPAQLSVPLSLAELVTSSSSLRPSSPKVAICAEGR